ncbi:MAG: DUF6057 family protein [Prevotella sp.]|nr:DUF6057 family protein [Prevotella sp.]
MKYLMKLTDYWKALLTAVFFIAVALFWALPYKSVLSYQEQYQMFLFDMSYFTERCAVPGGLVDYVAEYLTQFYYIPIVGALIIAALSVSVQRMTWVLCRRNGASQGAYPLSFIPPILLWAYMGDENVMLSFTIALLVAQWLMLYYHIVGDNLVPPHRKWLKALYVVVLLPAYYWIAGPAVLIAAVYIALCEVMRRPGVSSLGFALVTILPTVAFVIISSTFIQYRLPNLLIGINYYRYMSSVPLMQFVVEASVMVLPLIYIIRWTQTVLSGRVAVVVKTLFVAVAGGALVYLSFPRLKYDIIEYDYLVRTGQWSKIIAKAENRQPSTPMEVSCVNFALAMKGQLCDRLFEFYQNGSEGLFPTFQRDMFSPVSSSEILYQLAMINDAERYAFEAQESIANHRKSGRLTKTITKCNIINGHYEVARKYLRMLSKTMFYSKWAKEQLAMLNEKGAVEKDPVYSRMRAFRQKKQDFLFSDTEMDQMLGLLYLQNYDNRMAFEYLMAYELLMRDMEHFYKYYPLGQYAKYNRIPTAMQQALIYQWAQTHDSLRGLPWSLEPSTVQLFSQFASIYFSNKNDSRLGEPPFDRTFWNYMLLDTRNVERQKQKMKEIY